MTQKALISFIAPLLLAVMVDSFCYPFVYRYATSLFGDGLNVPSDLVWNIFVSFTFGVLILLPLILGIVYKRLELNVLYGVCWGVFIGIIQLFIFRFYAGLFPLRYEEGLIMIFMMPIIIAWLVIALLRAIGRGGK